MQPHTRLVKTIGLSLIAFAGITGCSQPRSFEGRRANTPDGLNNAAQNQTAPQISADDAADQVEDVLERHPTLGQFDLDADDEGNAIVLTGTVQDASQKQLAEDIAKSTASGFSVINRLNIR